SPKLAGGDNQVRFRGTPPEEDSAANGLNEPPFLDPPRMAKILVCVAWPYASGPRHLGHAVSTFIPADIFARYHRMKGDEVVMVSPFCTTDQRFLPDRYVEGTCPHCGFPRARGDQCENCGNLLDPFELKDPKCKIHGTTPIPKETKHFFFRLSAFEKPLAKWA